MEYWNVEEIEDLHKQLNDLEKISSATREEIRRLHHVCRSKEKEIEYWKNRHTDTCKEQEHPVFVQEGPMSRFLVQRQKDGKIVPTLMSGTQLINYINMADCHGESYEIFNCDSQFGEVYKLQYKGWQPNCLIELVDEHGEVVVKGYGEDH